jgi:hypothetical protein
LRIFDEGTAPSSMGGSYSFDHGDLNQGNEKTSTGEHTAFFCAATDVQELSAEKM